MTTLKTNSPEVLLASADADIGLVATADAAARAQAHANGIGRTVSLRDPTSDKLLATIKPAVLKAAKKTKASKPAKTAKAKAPAKAAKAKPAAKPKAERKPKGMVVKILALASRKDGVSPAELNKLTTWKGAPWKWLFSNPKGNGYCDRWGYKFKVVNDDGETRYCVTAK